ncbi:MAG: hypothetical protein ACXAAM_05855 [Candidatus Heimdallarchaeaceae archaeon]
MSKEKRGRKLNPKYFFVIHLGISLLALLSVIPFNLNMRAYNFDYELVPYATSLFCILIPLLLSFPFFNYSRQKINQSSSRYKYFTRKSYIQMLFIVLILVSLSLVIRFYLIDPAVPYGTKYPFKLSTIAIPFSYFTIVSTLIVIEQLPLSQNEVKKTDYSYKTVLSWIVLVLVMLSAISPFNIYISFIIIGLCGGIFLSLFVVAMIKFLKNEKEKKTEDTNHESKPFYYYILLIVFSLVTILYYALIILYMVFLVKGYLIISFREFYSGFFLAIQGSYVLFLIIFYSVIYWIMIKRNEFG